MLNWIQKNYSYYLEEDIKKKKIIQSLKTEHKFTTIEILSLIIKLITNFNK